MEDKAKHWLRFRLRTLFVGVVVLSVPLAWVAYSLNWIRDRREFMGRQQEFVLDPFRTPGGLWLLEESPRPFIIVGDAHREQEARRLFPEAKTVILSWPHSSAPNGQP